jgi:putative ABC transport system substrate-binding protein
MKRRAFISLLGGVVARPLMARAQQLTPTIGFLVAGSAAPFAAVVAAFHRGLAEADFIDGKNVTVEARWADGHNDRLPQLAADLIQRRLALIVTIGNLSGQTVKAAAVTLPQVFLVGDDPVKLGLVVSLSRPGGNATGVNFLVNEMEAKRLALLRELIPSARTIGYLVNPDNPSAEGMKTSLVEAARAVGQQLVIMNAKSEADFDAAFASFAQQRIDALVVGADGYFHSRRTQIVALAARYAFPAIYEHREFAAAGGLSAYGASITDAFRQVGVYSGRILKGEKPADIPVWQPTKFELVINLKTAKTLGLAIPDRLLALADEAIE